MDHHLEHVLHSRELRRRTRVMQRRGTSGLTRLVSRPVHAMTEKTSEYLRTLATQVLHLHEVGVDWSQVQKPAFGKPMRNVSNIITIQRTIQSNTIIYNI